METRPATKAEAQKALTALKRLHKPWIQAGMEQPHLIKREDGRWHIIWEGGPYEWAWQFCYHPDSGVWAEAQNTWSVAIWKD